MLNAVLRRVLHRYDRLVYGRGPTVAAQLPSPDARLGAAPIPPAWVRAGKPEASAQLLTSSQDGGLVTGVWECTPGRFRWYFACDEVIVVLSGEGRVRVGEREHVLSPGMSVFFPVGTDSEWEITRTLRKHFIHRKPTPHVHGWLSEEASPRAAPVPPVSSSDVVDARAVAELRPRRAC